MSKKIIYIIPFLFITVLLQAQEIEKRKYNTKKILLTQQAPQIDGLFNEAVWENVKWEDNFTQHEPFNGDIPGQQTSFKIIYNDNYIYFAIKAYDSAPDSIVTRLTKRDDIDGDFVGVGIDSYHDKLTSFTFGVSAAGVKLDMMQTNDGDSQDMNWDPIWYVKTMMVDDGWNAEMKIPLSQLRFDGDSSLVWGLEMFRMLFRKQELSLWQHIPNDAPGFISLFGELHGISNIKPKRQIEIAPYGVTSFDTYEKEDGNPYKDGSDFNYKAGLDGKIGITNNLILDFSVNPDFGQVEADASQVNLSAFETFYQEKRPFFIEGKNLFNFSVFGDGSGDMSAENLFYSRRIGRRPHGYANTNDGEYAKTPEFTNILGAAKLTGKTKNGFSFGVLESVTAEQKAEIDLDGQKRFETIEPLTNYFVGRVQKDFNKGITSLGGMITSTNRFIEEPNLEYLHSTALTGGLNFTHTWQEKKYYFTFNNMFSEVKGTEEAMIRTQRSSSRYYQRPDADHIEVDSSRTSLSGFGGKIGIGKQGGGHFGYGMFFTWKSPGLEINDIGFIRRTDEILQISHADFRTLNPFSIFRMVRINFAQWHGWDFSGTNLYTGLNLNSFMQFKNYWSLSTGMNSEFTGLSKTMLRGGPMFRTEGNLHNWFFVQTDERKKLVFSLNTSNSWGFNNSSTGRSYNLELSYRPTKTLQLSAGPSLSLSKTDLQYVTEQSLSGQAIYVFAAINQKIFSLNFRTDLNLTPNLSIQYWGQPFIASGEYSNFKKITDTPRADEYTDRFYTFAEGLGREIYYDETRGSYLVNESGGVSNTNYDYMLEKPDFNIKEFLSNLVIRWEYTPGSTLYVVWSQSRNGFNGDGRFLINEDLRNMFRIHPHNIFLIKFSYRFKA